MDFQFLKKQAIMSEQIVATVYVCTVIDENETGEEGTDL